MALQDRPSEEISPDNTYGFRRCCEVVREVIPIEKIACRYTDLEALGGRAWFTGRCPLPDHQDKDPSFYIYPPGRWWCYGCNRGGDVVDLEFRCGAYAELWEAMISLANEFEVKLPPRPASWFRRQERRGPVRYGIDVAKIHVARRRLYIKYFEPLILATEDQDAKAHDAQLFWEMTAPLAEHLVANMMGSRSDG